MTISLNLTEDELNKVQRKAKPTEELPKFFNANTEQLQTISRDFEAFLILADPAVINNAKEWLSKVNNLNLKNVERDEVIKDALLREKTDAVISQTEALTWVKTFEVFKSRFQVEQFSGVNEIGLMIRDLELFVGEHKLNEERFRHLDILSDLLTIKHQRNQTSPELELQLRSWETPLTTYL